MPFRAKGYSPLVSGLLSTIAWISFIAVTVVDVLFSLTVIIPYSLVFEFRTRRATHGVSQVWAKSLIATNPLWKLQVEGLQHVNPNETYVVVSNHQSILDILVALASVPLHFKFVAKKELFPIVGIGWHMFFAGYIPLERGNPESGKRASDKAREWLRKGISVLFFPEGTRSWNQQMHGFKSGAFKIAQEVGVRILPVVMDGTGAAVPKHSWRIAHRSLLKVSFGHPVKISQQDVLEEKVKSIREEMMKRLEKLRREGSKTHADSDAQHVAGKGPVV